ncbi:60S ribosomal protein L31 [Candidatus Woesearchaeota archaeon]|nr:60S ribosomal protein L31 [Candidatus Woesearchaeota archaeon]
MTTTKTPFVGERTYTVPLRKEYQKAPIYKRTKKAVAALRQFLQKHMKSEEVKLGKKLNEALWQRGITNPPHKVKVTATKNEKGEVFAELFGVQDKPKREKKGKKVALKKAEEAQKKETAAPKEKTTVEQK